MSRRKTTKEFITQAKILHGDTYDYSKVVYKNSKTKVIVLCKEHGEFTPTPAHHIRGSGCRKCYSSERTTTTEEFITKAKLVHEDIYDYSKVKYTRIDHKILIICKEHGEFEQTANLHLKGRGCHNCGGSKKLTTQEFINKAHNIHSNKYVYDKVNYSNSFNKVFITCLVHGSFLVTPNKHLLGQGCPSCVKYGFDQNKPTYLYYLKVTTNSSKVLYKIGITNRTVNERFQLIDLQKIEVIKQKLYQNGLEALEWETKLKQMYKQYQYKGPNVLSSGNTELFTEDIIALYDKENNLVP